MDATVAYKVYLLGRKTDIRTSGRSLAVATEFPMQLDLHFVQDGEPQVEMKEDDIFLALAAPPYGANVLKRLMAGQKPSPNWVRRDGKPADFNANMPDVERHVILRLAQKPGQEYHRVLFPRASDEPAPQVQRPARGAPSRAAGDGLSTDRRAAGCARGDADARRNRHCEVVHSGPRKPAPSMVQTPQMGLLGG
jgi:hypothetical protein